MGKVCNPILLMSIKREKLDTNMHMRRKLYEDEGRDPMMQKKPKDPRDCQQTTRITEPKASERTYLSHLDNMLVG